MKQLPNSEYKDSLGIWMIHIVEEIKLLLLVDWLMYVVGVIEDCTRATPGNHQLVQNNTVMSILLAGTIEFVHTEQVSTLFTFRLGQVLLYKLSRQPNNSTSVVRLGSFPLEDGKMTKTCSGREIT
jgi:hypothetical protein